MPDFKVWRANYKEQNGTTFTSVNAACAARDWARWQDRIVEEGRMGVGIANSDTIVCVWPLDGGEVERFLMSVVSIYTASKLVREYKGSENG